MNIFQKMLQNHFPRCLFTRRLLLGGFLLFFAGIALSLLGPFGDEKAFQQISEALFRQQMQDSTLNMHYTIAHPEDFGIPSYEARLPLYSAASRQESRHLTEETIAELKQLNAASLTDQDAYTYKLLARSLSNSLRMSNFLYYDEPLSPSSGMQTQLPILLAEYTFRSKRDVEDYLSLLDQTDEYFASLLTFEQEKAAAGLLMSASSLEKVRLQCDTIVTLEDLDKETHFLQISFGERMASLAKILTPEEARKYTAQNNRLLRTVLLPAYEALSDGLFLLKDSSIPLSGLASKPQGKAYYLNLLTAETGSYRPVAEIKKLLAERLQAEYQAIQELLTGHPDLSQSFSARDYLNLPVQDATSMLADLQIRMEASFPGLDMGDTAQAGNTLPSVTVKSVSPSLENYSAPAFYLTPPLDDSDTNVIYINQKNAPKGLDLYTTLAHEGYPGHLYQTVYNNRNAVLRKENAVRQLLWYGGYLEGWALYVEFQAYDCAARIMEEQNRETDALCIQLEKHNRSLQLCLFSMLDIMIHYENISYSQVAKVLQSFEATDANAASVIYAYIVEEPCNYLKYYLGYLEILKLQDTAREIWGSSYSDYAFHSFYLDSGPSDFSSLAQRLRASSQIPGSAR